MGSKVLDRLDGWKKLVAAALAILSVYVGSPAEVTYILIAYIVGQGVADVGKNKRFPDFIPFLDPDADDDEEFGDQES